MTPEQQAREKAAECFHKSHVVFASTVDREWALESVASALLEAGKDQDEAVREFMQFAREIADAARARCSPGLKYRALTLLAKYGGKVSVQYQTLGPDDVIQEGDERTSCIYAGWTSVTPGSIGKTPSEYGIHKFRRPIAEKENMSEQSHRGFDRILPTVPSCPNCANLQSQLLEAGKEVESARNTELMDNLKHWRASFRASEMEGDALRAQLAEARKALEPFMQAHKNIIPYVGADWEGEVIGMAPYTGITFAHLRQAAAVLEKLKGETER